MFGKKMRFAVILLASCGIPYLWFSEGLTESVQAQWNGLFGGSASSDQLPTETLEAPVFAKQAETEPGVGEPLAAGGETDQNKLTDVLRFDIAPTWVMERWPRVSTISAEKGLVGMRVPLVTGTDVADLAGSLTFYFDSAQRLQRISFHGRTGDDRKLVELATSQFRMKAEPSLGAGMYVSRWNGAPTSALRISYSPVVRSTVPHDRLQVAMEINRPDVGYGLSDEFSNVLLADRHTQRW